MTRAAAALACAVLACTAAAPGAVASAPEPSAAPQPAGTDLPEIGRTRAKSPACVAIREIVVPAFAAAQRADQRFTVVGSELPKYVQLRGEYASQHAQMRSDGVFMEGMLAHLSTDAAALAEQAAAIRKLIDDPRMNVADPQVQSERDALELLYETQITRARSLNQLVLRESTLFGVANVGFEDSIAAGKMKIPKHTDGSKPNPTVTAPPDMPLLNRNELANRERVTEWTASLAQYAHAGENFAAQVALPIAQGCR